MAVTFRYSQSATSGIYLYVTYEIELLDDLFHFGAWAPGVQDAARMCLLVLNQFFLNWTCSGRSIFVGYHFQLKLSFYFK